MSSDLQNKMLQWGTNPPEDTWNKIVASLGVDEEYMLQQKLSSFESQPPRHVWDHIEAGLEAHQPVRVVSFYQKHKRAFQYSGAAAALILAVVLINLFVSKPSVSSDLTHQSSAQSLPHLQGGQTATDSVHSSAGVNATSDSHALTGPHSTSVTSGGNSNPINHSSKASHKPVKNSGYHTLMAEWEQAKDSLVNRYFVHTNNRGEAIRFSSKLYDLFECSDEWTEKECAQQIMLWQQKAATSAMYASADFTGVLELLKGMEGMTNDE